MTGRVPARRVVQVAELVPLDSNRRRVEASGRRAAKLDGEKVHRIRLCWRVSGETSQRSRMFTRAELPTARRAHAELAACDPVAVVLPTTGPYAHGHARLLEDLILASVPLAWNFPGGPLWGFGGNAQGARRNAPPAPWWRVHGTTDPDENLVAAYHQWWAAQAPPVTGLLAR